MGLVSVQHEFEYTAKDGRRVSIKPNESFILVSKTNDHWWRVRRDRHARPFYVPAQYVKEQTGHSPDTEHSPERVTDSEPAPREAASRDASKETHRFSNFGFCENTPDVKPGEAPGEGQTGGGCRAEAHNWAGRFSSNSGTLKTDGLQLYAEPHPGPEVGDEQRRATISLREDKTEEPQAFVDDEDVTFPSPPNSPLQHDTAPMLNFPEWDSFPDPPSPVACNDPSASEQQQSSDRAAGATSSTEALLVEQAGNESLRSAVYVNVAQLRQSISESPPSAPSSCSPSYLDPEAWEVHTDQESGQEYYYHPASGHTTWDHPFLDSPTDPGRLPAEEPCSPSPPQSPVLPPSASSPPAWTSDWEQLVDESSGRPYFHNQMSGETSWELPEQLSPYPALMEPMSVHRFHEDGPPPLPEEDYPSEDYPAAGLPEAYDELFATGPPTLQKEYTLSHLARTVIPRANLDRSTPTGWNLAVDPNGTWVFTSEHCPDQRSVPTHRRNTSDYSSDSSSTGNSPETQHNVQNLEKAGILNKTKVCENGKKVRKNWAQTWTVLHGGVLTFHKDPKSAATGASNKTNQIVPEVTVDLRGAAIGWASKDKSSKKNVLELKGKNGVEFLIQYDTESIISDWYKVLMDTIRQLEYQDHHSEEEDGHLYEKIPNMEQDERATLDKRRSSRPSVTHSSSSAGDSDQRRVRTKLMKFLLKRPTLQSVKEKGYIRGLDIDGLYRVSGNLAVIQKLRFKADHEELDLEDGQWEDVHVITGALKLFFRELPEPLFPYSHFENFIAAIRIPDHKAKVSCMRDLVKSLPLPNHDTMEILFGHLCRVIQFWEDNRMTVQNVAIVFGPTLLRPEMEGSNIAMHMVFQNQIVEFILNEYERIFHSS
ncbi:hypothetical protein F2P81_022615 [Scophthalmus maximus]|uniref:Rho GTPase-activating protein 27-like n=1 Tax=Scophthalmus maximus TaxID=52904 RepID=A0A6A4S5C1_SCOMX|nr:hypothetical protein F2P81_022615 [Scophthalmus maximus]